VRQRPEFPDRPHDQSDRKGKQEIDNTCLKRAHSPICCVVCIEKTETGRQLVGARLRLLRLAAKVMMPDPRCRLVGNPRVAAAVECCPFSHGAMFTEMFALATDEQGRIEGEFRPNT
jgi:hypothetical protein